jgi:hypothetical protein
VCVWHLFFPDAVSVVWIVCFHCIVFYKVLLVLSINNISLLKKKVILILQIGSSVGWS